MVGRSIHQADRCSDFGPVVEIDLGVLGVLEEVGKIAFLGLKPVGVQMEELVEVFRIFHVSLLLLQKEEFQPAGVEGLVRSIGVEGLFGQTWC